MFSAEPNPWGRTNWTRERERTMYRDWGIFYASRDNIDTAAHYYDVALKMKDTDPKLRYASSKCKRRLAQTQQALEDAKAAVEYDSDNDAYKWEKSNALYELNQFENAKINLHIDKRKYSGKKVENYNNKIDTIDENFKDTLGNCLNPFILRRGNIFGTVHDLNKRKKHVDSRPLWNILKEDEKCDVLSVLEKEEVILSPREIARRDLAFNVFHQNYFNKSWEDVKFLKKMEKDPNLLTEQSKVSVPFLKDFITKKNETIKNYAKMLHSRSPLYSEAVHKCRGTNICEAHKEAHLNRIQHQTRRSMLHALRFIKRMRAAGDIVKLTKFVEEYMGDEVVKKTHRIMPWKFEFVNEVYNTLALAYSERCTVPLWLLDSQYKNKVQQLLGVSVNMLNGHKKFVFGDRSSFHEPDGPDYGLVAYKAYQGRMEKRLLFAKYSIEKCYILHEIARSHLNQNRTNECISVARKAIQESTNCRNILWKFNSIMLIVKAFAVLYKVENCLEALLEAREVALHLKNSELIVFIDVCIALNEDEMLLRKRSQSLTEIMKRQKLSIGSSSYSTSQTGSIGTNMEEME